MRRHLRRALALGLLIVAGGSTAAVLEAGGAGAAQVGPPLTGLNFYDIGGKFGYDPFTCPTGAPSGCGALLNSQDTGEYQAGFETSSGDGLAAGDTLTLTGPHGADFTHATVIVGWGGTTDENVSPSVGGIGDTANINVGCYDTGSHWLMTPDNDELISSGGVTGPGLYSVDNDGCQHEAAATVVAVNTNTITVQLPSGFSQTPSDTANGWPAVIQVSDAVNPPAGTYQPNQWTVSAPSNADANSDYSPGPVSNSPKFDNDDQVVDNSLLSVSSATIPVSTDSGAAVTATLRDQYGNPVSGVSVAIEPLSGNATPINAAETSTTTSDDGTLTEQFADAVAQPVVFEATVSGDSAADSFAIQQTPTVTYTPGPPVAANSYIELGSCTTACGSQTQVSTTGGTAAVHVGLADQYGNPDTGDEVVLAPQQPGQFKLGTVAADQASACPTGGSTPIITGAGCANTTGTLKVGSTTYTDAMSGFSVSDPTAEDVPFSVDDVTNGTTLALTPLGVSGSSPLTLDFLAGPPATTSISAASGQVTADGTTTDTITVKLTDSGGNPVPGLSVRLGQGAGGHAQITPAAATTDVTGTATFTVTDDDVEPVTFTASYTGTVNGNGVSGTVSGSATVAFVAGPTSATGSTLTAAPAAVLDNGVQSATVTVTLVDAQGHPAAGRLVTVAGSAGTNSLITPETISDATSGCPSQTAAGTTDCNGQIAVTVTDRVPEAVTYTATDQSSGTVIAQTGSVTFTAPPSPSTSTVVATPQTVAADGSNTATIQVTLLNADGAPVSGRQVCLTQTSSPVPTDNCATETAGTPSTVNAQLDPGSSCVQAPPAPGTTNCLGQALFTVSATSPGAVTYGVIDLTDEGPDGALLGPSATVTFIRAQTEAGESTVTATPAQVLAGGAGPSTSSTVTVQLLSATGSPLSGRQVGLYASSGTVAISPIASPATGCGAAPSPGFTDCNGVASFTVSDPVAETVSFNATDVTGATSILQHAGVTFLSNEAADATVTTATTAVPADNGLTSAGVAIITVALSPGQNGTDVGDRVSLNQPSGNTARVVPQGASAAASGCLSAAAAGITNCHGTVSFAVSDARPETVTFSAFDATTGVALSQSATVTFTPIVPLIQSVSPASGPLTGGTVLVVRGLGLTAGGKLPTITVGGRRVTAVRCTDDTVCTGFVPAGARTGVANIRVSTTIGESQLLAGGADHFTYKTVRPVILSLTPNHGTVRGGSTITLIGRYLEQAKAVSFGTTRVKPAKVNAPGTRLTVRVPARTKGVVEIRVTTLSGTSVTSTHTRFTYRPVAAATQKTTTKKGTSRASTR